MRPQDVLQFWFEETPPERWWKKDPAFDQLIREKFADSQSAAVRGELSPWRTSPEGRLAEIIVIDQFSRNIFRGKAEAFLHDPLALVLSQELVRNCLDLEIPIERRSFAYMPYMHSESLIIHDEAIKLFSTPGLEDNLDFEHKHRAILLRFGRYPHRNESLGRTSTPEEKEFLKTNPGF